MKTASSCIKNAFLSKVQDYVIKKLKDDETIKTKKD